VFRLIACLALLGGLCACAATPSTVASPSDDEFSAAWQEGDHTKDRDGAAYVQNMARGLGPVLMASFSECNGPRPGPARLAVQLNLDGSVRKAMVRPSTPYWECVKDSVAKKRFPPPPRDAFWTRGTLN